MSAASPILAAPPVLPEGYVPVALPDQGAAPLRIAVIVRKEADPVAGHFVILRTLLDAVVYLGCLTDAGGRLQGYVELWVQSLGGLAGSPAAAREALSNRALDERWSRIFKAYDALDESSAGTGAAGSTLLRTGYETKPPKPLFLDTQKLELLNPVDAFSSTPWSLCTDDAKLAAKGLPAYSSSLHRYLCADEKSPLIAITDDAPAGPNTAPLTEITGPKGTLKAFNPGGLMLVRRYAPIPLESFFDLLSGAPWEGILAGRSAVHLDRLNEALEEKNGSAGGADMADGRLFLGKHGKWGRLTETFHLKLRLLADCFTGVRTVTAQTQRPLLNITAQSFQVDIGAGAHAYALPFLWTAGAQLIDPGDAVSLKLEGTDAQHFLRGLSSPGNVYQPDSVTRPASGRGTLRIRKTMNETAGIILEGTFATQERLSAGGGGNDGPTKHDLVWLRVPVGSQRIDLFGHIEKEPALAAGEWRFRSERQKLPETLAAQLKSAEGVPIPETLFDVIPMLSAPCDMYALAILASRALLVDEETTLAITADELISLARQVALQHQPDVPLADRIRSIFQADSRWLNSLGPHRLTRETITPQDAFDLVPANLWFDTLGLLVRMFPAIGPDSLCRDYGDAPRGGIHKIFDPVLNTLDTLLVRTRSLIVIDWRFNREIHAVLRRFSSTPSAAGKGEASDTPSPFEGATFMIRKLVAFLLLTLPLMATGCICHPTKLNVTIELDEAMRQQLADRKIQVDIVGVNANQHARWEGYSMTKYWEPNDATRNSVPTYHIVFDPAKAGAQTLSISDPIWDKWPIWDKKDISDKDMPRLYVLAQLPGIWGPTDDQPGEKDPRRQILPLGDCRWKTKSIVMKIQKTGIITMTQQVRDNKNQ